MAWWAWLVTGFVLLAVEVMTVTFGIMFFGISAILLGMLLWAGVDLAPWLQWLLFSAISVVSLAFFRRPLMARWKVNEPKAIDTMVGEQAIARDDIPAGEKGKAELRGTTWTVVNVGEAPILRGQHGVVAGTDGIVLHLQAK